MTSPEKPAPDDPDDLIQRLLATEATWSLALGWSLALITVAIILRYAIDPLLGPGYPYVTFYPAVVLAAVVAGFRGVLVCGAAALAAAWFLFLPVRLSFETRSTADVISLFVFVANVSAGAICAALLRRAATRISAARARQTLLIAELNHRVKNNLAMVISLARMSARDSESKDAFVARLEDRLISLSRTHELLSAGDRDSLEIKSIVESELAAFGDRRVLAEGPEVSLPATRAVAVGLIVHELATNSAKYGALSGQGSVRVNWRQVGTRRWCLIWEEADGPPVTEPQRRGFGSDLIERLAKRALGGKADLNFRPAGLRADIQFNAA